MKGSYSSTLWVSSNSDLQFKGYSQQCVPIDTALYVVIMALPLTSLKKAQNFL